MLKVLLIVLNPFFIFFNKINYLIYVRKNNAKKLHVGCGNNFIIGWLNTDYLPRRINVYRLDITKRMPFKKNTFDLIYSEHLIEHVNLNSAAYFLSECFRVLKPGGKIRICTPDINFLFSLFMNKNELSRNYVDWFIDENRNSHLNNNIYVINMFFSSWGHKFIYDANSLKSILLDSGFKDIQLVNDSNYDIDFYGIDNSSRMPKVFYDFETMIIDAKK